MSFWLARRTSLTALISATVAAAAVLSGCSENAVPGAAPEPVDEVFAPMLTVEDTASETVDIAVANGTVSLTVPYPSVEITDVDDEIADAFTAAVAAQPGAVAERAAAFETIAVDGCDGTCAREATLTLDHAGVYEQYGTVASTTNWVFGTRDRNAVVQSITMDLRTGEPADITDFLDLSDPQIAARAEASVRNAENGASCDPAQHLAAIDGFAPTADGLLLLWEIDQTHTAQCGVGQALVPWEGEVESAIDPNSPDGTWCPTPESESSDCITIAGDAMTYADGNTQTITISPGFTDGALLELGGEGVKSWVLLRVNVCSISVRQQAVRVPHARPNSRLRSRSGCDARACHGDARY